MGVQWTLKSLSQYFVKLVLTLLAHFAITRGLIGVCVRDNLNYTDLSMSTLEAILQNWNRPHVIIAEKNSSFVNGGMVRQQIWRKRKKAIRKRKGKRKQKEKWNPAFPIKWLTWWKMKCQLLCLHEYEFVFLIMVMSSYKKNTTLCPGVGLLVENLNDIHGLLWSWTPKYMKFI